MEGKRERWLIHGWGLGVAAILCLYAAWLSSNFVPAITHPDANGYWAQGSLLAQTGRTWYEPENGLQYVGMHWLLTESGRYASRYSPGLAVVVAGVYNLFGARACLMINPVLALLSLWGLYLVLRKTAGPGWGLLGVAVLATNPQFNEHALTSIAHMPVLFLLTWGLVFLLRWSDGRKLWEAFAAGLLLGAIPVVRYPEGIFALGIGVFLLLHFRAGKRIWLEYAAAGLGALLPIVPLLVRNRAVFGSFYQTGYALTNEQTGFGWSYFRDHYLDYLKGLNSEALALFFALGVIGVVVMCARREQRRPGILLALLIVPSTLLYMAYYWGGQGGMSMRFLVPTFVCYVIAGIHALVWMTRDSSAALKTALVAVVLALQCLWGVSQSLENVRDQKYQKEILARVTSALEKETAHDDLVIADNGILQHLDFVRHWRLVDLSALRSGRQMMPRLPRVGEDNKDADAPRPMQAEKMEARLAAYSGLSPLERERAVAADIREWAGDGQVYYVGSESGLRGLPGRTFNEAAFEIVARITLPERPAKSGRRGMPGMPPGLQDMPRPGMPDPDMPDRDMPGPDRIAKTGGAPGNMLNMRRRPDRGMGGMGMAGIAGEKELIIARWEK